jgi:hypothetical protein
MTSVELLCRWQAVWPMARANIIYRVVQPGFVRFVMANQKVVISVRMPKCHVTQGTYTAVTV